VPEDTCAPYPHLHYFPISRSRIAATVRPYSMNPHTGRFFPRGKSRNAPVASECPAARSAIPRRIPFDAYLHRSRSSRRLPLRFAGHLHQPPASLHPTEEGIPSRFLRQIAMSGVLVEHSPPPPAKAGPVPATRTDNPNTAVPTKILFPITIPSSSLHGFPAVADPLKSEGGTSYATRNN
jgi:hypothetical protein